MKGLPGGADGWQGNLSVAKSLSPSNVAASCLVEYLCCVSHRPMMTFTFADYLVDAAFFLGYAVFAGQSCAYGNPTGTSVRSLSCSMRSGIRCRSWALRVIHSTEVDDD